MSIPLPPMSNTIVSTPKQLPILSRHENYRLCFLLIGNKFHIPYDLIKFIYLILSKEKIKEFNQCVMFHTNILHMKHFQSCAFLHTASKNKNYIQQWKSYFQEICENFSLTEDYIFSYRIPMNKYSEWVIQKSVIRNRYLLPPNPEDPNLNILGFLDCKEQITMEIKIIGSRYFAEDYFSDDENRWITKPASRRNKINYLNSNNFHDIEYEFMDWIDMNGEERYPEFHII